MIRVDPPRASCLARLTSGALDVLVIGGGITGAGVALDAASRGYAVGLVEQGDFASGTSSRSTKLIHGGIRYLAKGQLQLVREALHERTVLQHLAQWLVRPQPFLIPLYAHLHRPLGVQLPWIARPLAPAGIRMTLWGYDRFAGKNALPHRRLSRDEVAQRVPALVQRGLRAAYLFYDARTDDVRLTHAVLATAKRYGATTLNYARACKFLFAGGRISGVVIEDRLTGAYYEIRVPRVVNATGVWSEQVAELAAPPPFRIQQSKGIHLVLRKGAVDSDTSVVIPETDDGRLLFLTPWADHMLLGTTDDPYSGPLDAPRAAASEVTYLLDHANRYLTRSLEAGDIAGIYAGLRPLIASKEGAPSTLSREHAVVTSSEGLVSIIGGKLTSYRKMAEDTVNELIRLDGAHRPCRTASLPLEGTEGWEAARDAIVRSNLEGDQRDYLLATYGASAVNILETMKETPNLRTRLAPPEPVLAAEVLHACRVEMCVSLVDFMFLRSRLSVVAEDAGASAVERVSELMAAELGWNTAELIRQREGWEAAVARERAALTEVRDAARPFRAVVPRLS